MKKLLALSLVVVSLSACGTKTIIKEVAPSTTVEVIAEQPQGGETEYFQAVVDNYPNLVNNMGRKFVIDFGYTMCGAISEGTSLSELAEMSNKYNLDIEMVGFLIGKSILNLCPENQWFIDAAGNA
jgi:hypothetical protein